MGQEARRFREKQTKEHDTNQTSYSPGNLAESFTLNMIANSGKWFINATTVSIDAYTRTLRNLN